MDHNNDLKNLRHSAAHLLAHAVLELYPETKLTIGPVTNEGFFYDFLPTTNFKEEDLARIEEKMHEIAQRNLPIEQKEISKEEALKRFAGNPFKIELIEAIPDKTVGLSCQGDFCDLCKGGHVASTGDLKHFKLLNISGSYWRADKNNQALQRISGTAFVTAQDMADYEKRKEEAALYDHRKVGKQLDLFSFHEEGPGFVFYHPKGFVVRSLLMEHMRNLQKNVYKEIAAPIILSEDLWKTSGHYDHYRDKMYYTEIDERPFCIKPMNCPGHILLYKEKPRSYRELPMRMSEFGLVHRHELSGVLHGLFRVRSFTQDDAHIFCTPDQLADEVTKLIEFTQKLYGRFGFKNVTMAIATKPENALGSDEYWEKATNALRTALEKNNIKYEVHEGDGAFYGPKIDIYIEDAMGRQWQCGTIQIDFFLPQRFEISYVASDGTRKSPVMIHRAIYGSLERFLGILLEHYKGKLPFWLAPVQVKLLTITDEQKSTAREMFDMLQLHNIRVELDESSDQISAQIKNAQLEQVPVMLVLGKKEVANNTVTVRLRDGSQKPGMPVDQLIEYLNELNKE